MTIRSLAEATGCSIATVSRALNKSPSVRDETIRAVQEAADRLGYRRSASAAGLRIGSTGVICLVMNMTRRGDRVGELGALHLVSGIHERLEGTNFSLNLVPHRDVDDPVEIMEQVVRQGIGDGVIFAFTSPEDERIKLLRSRGIPFVTFGRTELALPHAYYDVDNADFAYRATAAAIARGARRPLLISPPMKFMFAWHRRIGFIRALSEAGLVFDEVTSLVIEDDENSFSGIKQNILAWDVKPDAYICNGDVSAMMIIQFLREQNLTVGKDVQVATMQRAGLLDYLPEPVITFDEDVRRAGYVLADFLLKCLDGMDVRELTLLETATFSTIKSI